MGNDLKKLRQILKDDEEIGTQNLSNIFASYCNNGSQRVNIKKAYKMMYDIFRLRNLKEDKENFQTYLDEKKEIEYEEFEVLFLKMMENKLYLENKISLSKSMKAKSLKIRISSPLIFNVNEENRSEYHNENTHTCIQKIFEETELDETKLQNCYNEIVGEILFLDENHFQYCLYIMETILSIRNPIIKTSIYFEIKKKYMDFLDCEEKDVVFNFNYHYFKRGFLKMICKESKMVTKLGPSLMFALNVLEGEQHLRMFSFSKAKNLLEKKMGIEDLKPAINFGQEIQINQRGLRISILSEVLKHLSHIQIVKCGTVSREWLRVSRSETVWRPRYLEHFSELSPYDSFFKFWLKYEKQFEKKFPETKIKIKDEGGKITIQDHEGTNSWSSDDTWD